MKNLAISTALVVTAVAGTTAFAISPAQADVERHGSCAGASYELSVDREHRGFEVDADVDRAAPGSAWKVTLRHDGKVVHSRTHRADAEGEVDVDTWRRNTRGKDTFVLKVKPAGESACTARVTMR